MTTKRPTSKRRPALRLPTAAAFAALPLAKRTALFARWLTRQPKRRTYAYDSLRDCVLGAFAQALFRSPEGNGVTSTIYPSTSYSGEIEVFDSWELERTLFYTVSDDEQRTFDAASRAFNAALRASLS